MSLPLLILVTTIYACVTIDNFLKGNIGIAIMFAGYTVANIGVIKLV